MIHNWRAGALVSSMKGGSDKILSAAFAPDDSYLVTVGIDHVCFWIKNAAGTTYRQQRGTLGSVSKVQPFISVAFAGNNAVAGGADGSLVLFNEEFKATGAIPAHDGPVTAMFYEARSGVILTGGQDGNLKIWKTKGKITETACHNFGSGIRSASIAPGQDYLVGTEKSEIFQVRTGMCTIFIPTPMSVSSVCTCVPEPVLVLLACCAACPAPPFPPFR